MVTAILFSVISVYFSRVPKNATLEFTNHVLEEGQVLAFFFELFYVFFLNEKHEENMKKHEKLMTGFPDVTGGVRCMP
jgi:hypothetical protein